MYETDIITRASKLPVFSLSDASQLIRNRDYAKKVVARMALRKQIMRIKKDLYTVYDDPLLVATFILRPSYISGVSALSYYHLITQIPKEVSCFTTKPTRRYFFMEKITFHKTSFFFGFEMKKYLGFEIPIATPEKALIDSLGKVPVSVIDEAFDEIDPERMVEYLRRVKKSSVVQRIGYLLDAHGKDVFPALKKYVGAKYIVLDPLAKRKRTKNKKSSRFARAHSKLFYCDHKLHYNKKWKVIA